MIKTKFDIPKFRQTVSDLWVTVCTMFDFFITYFFPSSDDRASLVLYCNGYVNAAIDVPVINCTFVWEWKRVKDHEMVWNIFTTDGFISDEENQLASADTLLT